MKIIVDGDWEISDASGSRSKRSRGTCRFFLFSKESKISPEIEKGGLTFFSFFLVGKGGRTLLLDGTGVAQVEEKV